MFGRLLSGISNLPHVAHEGHTCRRTRGWNHSVIFSKLIANRKCITTAPPPGSAFHYPCSTCGHSTSRNLYNLRDAVRSILSCSPSFPASRIVNSRTARLVQFSSAGVRSRSRFETRSIMVFMHYSSTFWMMEIPKVRELGNTPCLRLGLLG